MSGEVVILSGFQALTLVPDTSTPEPFPVKLSDTGCVDENDPSLPAPGTIPYDVSSPLWSDGAVKTRWFAVPSGETIDVFPADGDFDMPIGSVTVKTFFLDEVPVETRLFVRHDDGGWAGYTYEWDGDGADATLLEGEKTKTIGNQTWTYPSRAQCLQCHGIATNYSLGLETLQLNREYFNPSTGRTANQMETLDHLGLLNPPLSEPVGELPAMRGDSLAEQARGYLHANCSNCHRRGGGAGVNADFQYNALNLNACGQTPSAGDLGVTGASVLAPGDPALSILAIRMHLLGENQMPPLSRSIVDPTGTLLIDSWISSWTDCNEGPDSDLDGVSDAQDNCTIVPNPAQIDSIGNGIGDACRTFCNDGIDNDSDGLTDYPADPSCERADSTTERADCSDGVDNDGDGFIDSPFDLGCQGKFGQNEASTCSDGLDNDGNGFLDWLTSGGVEADLTCLGRPYNSEAGSLPPAVPALGGIASVGLAISLAWIGMRQRRGEASAD